MNIEDSIIILKNIKKLVDIEWKHHITDTELLAIETLLTAYEKEKEENKKWKDYVVNDLENQITERNNKIFKLEAELEKEKEKNKKTKEFIKENSHEFNCKRDDLIELEFDDNTNATDLIDILDGNW